MSMRSGLVTLGPALRARLGSAAAQVLSLVESGMEALEAARLVEPSARSFRRHREPEPQERGVTMGKE